MAFGLRTDPLLAGAGDELLAQLDGLRLFI